ncbi:glycosyltransferase family 25 protein, partial [Verrucomicrobium spinosum]
MVECRNGAWGCLLSHARVLAEAIADGIENVLILEDDVVFQPDAGSLL